MLEWVDHQSPPSLSGSGCLDGNREREPTFVFNSLPIFDIVVFLSPLHLVDRPTQHFTFGYLFVELVVGSPVGMRNFLSEALASARGRLSPIFFQNWLPMYM